MSCVFHRLRHRWFPGLTRKAFLGGLRPPRPPQFVGRCRGLRSPGGPHGHRFGRPLSRPPKASVWGHVQDQPRSACLVRMIWVQDQHVQHWPNGGKGGPPLSKWTLSKWTLSMTPNTGFRRPRQRPTKAMTMGPGLRRPRQLPTNWGGLVGRSPPGKGFL